LTAALADFLARIRYIPLVLAQTRLSPVGNATPWRGALNPGVEAEPHVFDYQFSGFSC